MEYLIMIMMIIFAIFSIQTEVLRRAVIYAGVFSLLCSFSYLYYNAPDVAIAEAVIGCTLSTIIYLVALTKYKIFRVYYILNTYDKVEREHLLSSITRFSDYMSLQQDVISTSRTLDQILEEGHYDVVIIQNEEGFDIYGETSNYHFDNLIDFLNLSSEQRINYKYISSQEEGNE